MAPPRHPCRPRQPVGSAIQNAAGPPERAAKQAARLEGGHASEVPEGVHPQGALERESTPPWAYSGA